MKGTPDQADLQQSVYLHVLSCSLYRFFISSRGEEVSVESFLRLLTGRTLPGTPPLKGRYVFLTPHLRLIKTSETSNLSRAHPVSLSVRFILLSPPPPFLYSWRFLVMLMLPMSSSSHLRGNRIRQIPRRCAPPPSILYQSDARDGRAQQRAHLHERARGRSVPQVPRHGRGVEPRPWGCPARDGAQEALPQGTHITLVFVLYDRL